MAWNGEQLWDMHITVQTPKFYLLRTDMDAMLDLSRDWSSNSPDAQSVAFFIPSSLNVRLDFRNAEWMYLVNEHNVVARPGWCFLVVVLSLTFASGFFTLIRLTLFFLPKTD